LRDRTNQANGDELMEQFVSDYPTNVAKQISYIEVTVHLNKLIRKLYSGLIK
jgi:hypothetical protein